jgi:hypothetical protein
LKFGPTKFSLLAISLEDFVVHEVLSPVTVGYLTLAQIWDWQNSV